LVDHLVQYPAKQVRRDVQGLALANQALRNGFTLDVGRPDGLVANTGCSNITALWRLVINLARPTGAQGQ
jgi:hypothetical protein